ncbi:hypothetical protein TIFTF001_017499 [Ficus carica]|uniref:Uncharacterized protein n=1 Tax=Ficus carica TaxID=3494 RepID=A0AA88A862_FICCA|nr:hypothetical protein TIFTF001_017499 [Ficus carica]
MATPFTNKMENQRTATFQKTEASKCRTYLQENSTASLRWSTAPQETKVTSSGGGGATSEIHLFFIGWLPRSIFLDTGGAYHPAFEQ